MILLVTSSKGFKVRNIFSTPILLNFSYFKMNIILTGSEGFVGKYLRIKLEELNYNVFCIG
jgi:hypothetical protein